MNQSSRAHRKVLQGIVVSTRSPKTIVVEVERTRVHPLYGKRVSQHRKFHAHNDREEIQDGDLVRIVGCRPLSAKKRWRLLRVVQRKNSQ